MNYYTIAVLVLCIGACYTAHQCDLEYQKEKKAFWEEQNKDCDEYKALNSQIRKKSIEIDQCEIDHGYSDHGRVKRRVNRFYCKDNPQYDKKTKKLEDIDCHYNDDVNDNRSNPNNCPCRALVQERGALTLKFSKLKCQELDGKL